MTNHCRAMKGKESLENLNEKEGRNGDDNFVRDKRVSFNNRPACRAGLHSGCRTKYTIVFIGSLPSHYGRENIGN